jgi:recombination protein RecA
LKEHPKLAAAIERAIRANAGLIVDKMLVEPEAGEADEEVPDEDGVLPDADDGAKKPARAKR